MNKNHFTEEDHKRVIDFLNTIGKHAKMNLSVQEICDFFKLLAHMQQVILPKINSHILEVKEVGIFDKDKFDAAQQAEKNENK